MKSTPIDIYRLIEIFAKPDFREINDFVEHTGLNYLLPKHWQHSFPDGTNNRHLIGALSYFVYRTIPSLHYTVTVLSRYNQFRH